MSATDNPLLDNSDRIDDYTVAHLGEAAIRIEQALDAQYIRNLNDIRIRVSMPQFRFGEQDDN